MNASSDATEFRRLRDIIARLRADNGCPWDQRQTPQSLKKYLLEETEELAQAIDRDDPAHVCEEIGDLFYILCMLTAMYSEQGCFTVTDTLSSICEKMIRRHPHVFAGAVAGDDEALRRQWEAIKADEKKNS
ncbi:MazG nucleotide pyrophosphohydrolase domain-containing protein [Desulfolithobacter sp.]